jgi:hypothetical protein
MMVSASPAAPANRMIEAKRLCSAGDGAGIPSRYRGVPMPSPRHPPIWANLAAPGMASGDVADSSDDMSHADTAAGTPEDIAEVRSSALAWDKAGHALRRF